MSSTGHLLLAEHWLPRQTDLFNTVIQCGTVLAVVVVFTSRIRELLFNWREPETRTYFLQLTAAFLLTGAGGLILKKLHFKLPETVTPVASATLIGGVFFLVVEQWLRNKPLQNRISWRVALAVGVAQLLAAVFPGTSRSGVTILAALVLGTSRPAATEFSFLLGVPTLLAAGGLQIVSAVHHHETAGVNWTMLLLASIVAAVVAFATVKWLLRFVQSHTFIGFGWYRILLGIAMLALVR